MGVVVNDHVHIGAVRMQLQVQADGGSNVPLALDNRSAAIELQDVAGGHLIPCELPRVGEDITVGKSIGDVAGDVIIPSFAE